MALVLQRPKWNGDLWPSDYIETRKRIHWKGGLSQWVLWTLLQSWASASPAFVPDTHSAKIITRHKNNRPSLANWTVIFNQLSMWTNRLSVALFFYNHISTHVWKCQKFSSFLVINLLDQLLFTPFSVTRFAMHRIYANRINSRGMSRVFCDLRSQKTPRGILPVNSNWICQNFKK